jgi:hypothetical protein
VSIYDDPTVWEDIKSGEFAPTIKLTRVGDRVRGVVTDITVFEGRGQNPAPKYHLAEVSAQEDGVQSRYEVAELIAGTKSMKGQMYSLQPRKGDRVDVKLVELRPTGQPSPAKIFEITVTPFDGPADEAAGAAEAEPNVFDD